MKERSAMWGTLFCILCISGYMLGFYINPRHGFNQVYSFGLGTFGLVALAIWVEQKNWFRFTSMLGWLGDASYVIYLCHMPFLGLFYFLGIRNWLGNQNALTMELGFLLYMMFILLFSMAFHYAIEHRLYRKTLEIFRIRASSRSYP